MALCRLDTFLGQLIEMDIDLNTYHLGTILCQCVLKQSEQQNSFLLI
jgi:hypothetical protein